MAPVTGQVGRKRGPGDLRASGLSDPRCLTAFSTENHLTDRSNVKRYWSFACSNFVGGDELKLIQKLSEQIKNNTASRSTFKLSVQGPSPLFRTPWWSEGLSASYDSPRALTVASNLQQAEVSKF
ncbi:hypothetical protein PI124_g19134 [Phytophthora idaei]|nr:hypothetical protein PI124_g19134 [Phytophthora idaei]